MMELQTVATIAGILSPLIVGGVAWGTYTARVKAAEEKADRAYAHADRAHVRLDTMQRVR